MLKIIECKVVEKNQLSMIDGYNHEVLIRKYVNFKIYDNEILKDSKLKVNDQTKWSKIYSYVLEDKNTGRLLSLKTQDKIPSENEENVFVGLKNDEIITYSTEPLNGNEEIEQTVAKPILNKEITEMNLNYYLRYIFIGLIFLVPFAVTIINFKIVLKNLWYKEFKGYQININIVKAILIIFALMPLKSVYYSIISLRFDMWYIFESFAFWGLINAVFLIGGKFYLDYKYKKDIEYFNKIK